MSGLLCRVLNVQGFTSDTHNLSHCRSLRPSAQTLTQLLAAATALALLLGGPVGAAAAECTRFRGSGCHFTVRHETPVLYPACLSECNFEVSACRALCLRQCQI